MLARLDLPLFSTETASPSSVKSTSHCVDGDTEKLISRALDAKPEPSMVTVYSMPVRVDVTAMDTEWNVSVLTRLAAPSTKDILRSASDASVSLPNTGVIEN
eukprot:TRINITY_DN13119_c0_g1::TRINITY_DN13119_c0_g1_i1::g.10693::m.10693 TRINITY_DN13119_c0_g1::TRINITY_DN13119_c0_g1_i1::g.10693  ORF type:complete len:102 (-),score=21.46,GP11/PF08677.5/0.098 TRINITY_DN13119_c0_g1_i1:131-436(-)